jgi:hypothetical protein
MIDLLYMLGSIAGVFAGAWAIVWLATYVDRGPFE